MSQGGGPNRLLERTMYGCLGELDWTKDGSSRQAKGDGGAQLVTIKHRRS